MSDSLKPLNYLPAVLHGRKGFEAISMERALKQIRSLLDQYPEADYSTEQRLDASMYDIDFMLASISRD